MKANIDKRLVPVEIAGTTYYLNFSVNAAKWFAATFGDNTGNYFEGKPDEDAFDSLLKMYEILIEQGALYLDIVEQTEEHPRLGVEQLGILLAPSETADFKEKLTLAMNAGSSREVEIVAPKNAKTAQDK